jgi:hypothetical protein
MKKKIGIIVDGQAEYRSLPELMGKIQTPYAILNPIYADIQPFAPPGQIAQSIRKKLPILKAQNAKNVIVLIDRETRTECPGEFANSIMNRLQVPCANLGFTNLTVVIKDKTFENWLLSDPVALRQLRGRFHTKYTQRQTLFTRADTTPALQWIKEAVNGESYNKVSDSINILRRADPLRMAISSRSFRRFLRVVGHPLYFAQSKKSA